MRILGLGVALLLFLFQTGPSLQQGVYSDKQADRGKDVYTENCSFCHGESGDGGGTGPALYGDDFLKEWDGQTLADLFDKVQQTMPANDPGKLSSQDTVDILAFVLRANKFPSAADDLKSDKDVLKSIPIKAN